MTKQHFIALADWIRDDRQSESTTFSDAVVYSLSVFLSTQNLRFNRVLWLDYVSGKCGPNGGKR